LRKRVEELAMQLASYTTEAKTVLKFTDLCPACSHPGQCERCWYVTYAATCGDRDAAVEKVKELQAAVAKLEAGVGVGVLAAHPGAFLDREAPQ
jgi:hypothetical protein